MKDDVEEKMSKLEARPTRASNDIQKETIQSAGRIAGRPCKKLWKVPRCASTVIGMELMFVLNCQLTLFHWLCQFSRIQLSKHIRVNGDYLVSWPGHRGHGG